MVKWSLIFLAVALVAAVFGFGGIAGTAAWLAKIIFVAFLVIAVGSFLMNAMRKTG